MNTKLIVVAALAALAIASVHAAEQPTPGFNHKIPEEIMTPDTVKTRIGTLNFVDGVPTAETARIARGIDTMKPAAVYELPRNT